MYTIVDRYTYAMWQHFFLLQLTCNVNNIIMVITCRGKHLTDKIKFDRIMMSYNQIEYLWITKIRVLYLQLFRTN